MRETTRLVAPHPGPSSSEVSRRMSRLRRRDNGPEMAIRRLLHSRGLRYRVAYPVPGQRRRTIDIAFTRARLAVYIDGCFWHGCPQHGTSPRANAAWWAEKLAVNRARDTDVTAQLQGLGWTVLRIWEHEDPDHAASCIAEMVTGSKPTPVRDGAASREALGESGPARPADSGAGQDALTHAP